VERPGWTVFHEPTQLVGEPGKCLAGQRRRLGKRANDGVDFLAIQTQIGAQLHDISDAGPSSSVVTRRLVEPRIYKRSRRLGWQDAMAARPRIGGVAVEIVDAAALAIAIVTRSSLRDACERQCTGDQHSANSHSDKHVSTPFVANAR